MVTVWRFPVRPSCWDSSRFRATCLPTNSATADDANSDAAPLKSPREASSNAPVFDAADPIMGASHSRPSVIAGLGSTCALVTPAVVTLWARKIWLSGTLMFVVVAQISYVKGLGVTVESTDGVNVYW